MAKSIPDLTINYEDGHWYIFDGKILWSPYGYKDEWEAIEDIRKVSPEAAEQQERIMWSVS